MRAHLLTAVLATASLGANAAVEDNPAFFPSPWGRGGPDGWDEAYEKAREFVGQLTLAEKVNLTTGTGWEADRCVGMTGSVPRLGFRGLCLMDGPLGVRYADLTSAFPAGISTASTFSRRLAHQRGLAMGREFRGKGADIQLGPSVGPLGMFPEGGRNWEGFGPDPYLAGAVVGETVRGIQEGGTVACVKHYVLNEQEHFRNSVSGEVGGRGMHEVFLWPFADAVRAGVGSLMCSYNRINGSYACENAWTTNYLLKNELDFQGFVMSDWGAQHTPILSALTGLDMAMPGDLFGPSPTGYNSHWGGALTEAVLTGLVPQWRLDDMVVRIMAAYYKVHVGDNEDRVPINFSAWTQDTYGPEFSSANMSWIEVNEHVDVQADHAALIREIGAKSVVLLKNDRGVLPLKKPASMAVIGEDAYDNPDGPNACPDRGCNNGTLAMAWGSGTTDFPYLIAPATALLEKTSKDSTDFIAVRQNYDLDPAREAAAGVEVALVFANANAGENYIVIDDNAGDRQNLTLWKGGDDLVRAVAASNANTVLVLHTVGPVLLEEYKAHPNITAILWAGLPGQESGNALVDVLYGDVNPQGRSPFTWGKERDDYGVELLYESSSRTPSQDLNGGLFIDYRYFDKHSIAPTYEFGFGLSYTSFAYSDLVIAGQSARPYEARPGVTVEASTYGEMGERGDYFMPEGFEPVPRYVYPWVKEDGKAPEDVDLPEAARSGDPQPLLPAGGAPGGNPRLYEVVYKISVTVENTGDVAGTEIPQLYVSHGDPTGPLRVLRGFEEVDLEPGEAKTVDFELNFRDLATWDEAADDWVLGQFEKMVFVGASSRDLRLNGTLEV